jgi:subtilisin family serine protease/subtilisin-like proprotein convertase family protein
MNKFYSFLFALVFLVSCGGGGGGGGGSEPQTPPSPPIVNLSANPTSVLLESTSTLTWSSSNASSCSADWTSKTSSSGSDDVTISTAGDNSFSISCRGDGGSRSASVTIEGYRNTDGVVVDGYISGAEVCIDENNNWVCDTSESSTTSDNDGKFTIKYANGNLVSIGGTDLDSQTLLDNLLITHKLNGHSEFKAVTPVTSIAAFMEDASLVNAVLGIDSSIDVFTSDPVASKGDGGIYNYLYEKGNQLTVIAFAVQNITNKLNTTTETTQDYFQAIAEEIEKEYTETQTKVDIETETFVTKVFDNIITAKSVTIDETAKSNTVKALAGVMPVIEVKSEDDLTTAVIRFAISTLQSDIQTIADGSASAETVISYTEDILNYIAEDQSIDASKITPEITAIADSASTQEDTVVEINVLQNDSYITTAPINISINDSENGAIELTESYPQQLIYTPNTDYNGTDTFSYTITQGDKTSSADVTVTIESVNDEPTIDVPLTIKVDENQTGVTTVSVSDVDKDDVTLTLGGTDAASFNLSGENVLTFKEAPDYESKSSYSLRLSATDGIATSTKDITIEINNLNDNPPIFTTGNVSIDENITVITTITASDADGDPLIFSLKDNTNDNAELLITPDGVLSFVTAADYETKTQYGAGIIVTDGVFSDETAITIFVNDVNDNPPVIVSSGFSSDENQTTIGTIEATDADTNTEFTYTISGTDADSISLTEDGVLSYVSSPDYEAKSSYVINLNVSDGLNSTDKELTLEVNNILEDIISKNFTISNGTASQAPILDVDLQLDELSGAKRVYAVLYTTTNTSDLNCGAVKVFELANTSPTKWTLNQELDEELQQVCKYNIDYYFNFYDIETETAPPTPGIHLSYGNGRLYSDEQYSTRYFGVKDDQVTIENIRSKNAIEKFIYNNTEYVWHLYSPSQEYPSECNVLSYNLADGTTTPSLAVPEYQCTMAMITNSSEDPEKITYDFYIYSAEKMHTHRAFIRLPVKAISSEKNGRANSSELLVVSAQMDDNDSRIGRLTFTVDREAASNSIDYSRIIVDSHTKSMLYSGSDWVYVPSPIVEMSDTQPPEIVSAEFSNYTNPSSPQRDFIKIDFKTLNEAGSNGVVTSLRDLWISARSPDCSTKVFYVRDDFDGKIDTSLSDISATFPLLKSELGTYQIDTININDFGFAESQYSGLLSDNTNTNALIGSTFTAGDGNDPSCPLFLTYPDDGTITMDENELFVGTFVAQGSQADSVIYSLENDFINNTDKSIISDKLQVNQSTGEITYKVAPDYDKLTDFDSGLFVLRATSSLDPTLYRQILREIVLNNLNDSAPEIITTELSANENQTAIGCITHADIDINVEATFVCTSDEALGVNYPSLENSFSVTGDNILIDSQTGELSFETAPDYEETTSYIASVTIFDGENSTTSDITINVTDLNDVAPIVSSATSYSVKENQSSGGTIQITDPDTVNVFTFTIDEAYEDGSLFTINSSGELSFVSNPDYEAKNSYKVRVTINDGVFEITEDFSITLEDVIAEAIPTSANLNLLPQSSNTTTVQLLSSVLEGRTATYSIEVEPTYGTATLNTTTGVISYTTDYSDIAVEKISFRVNDGVVDDGVADLTLNLNSDPAYKQSWYLDNTGQSSYASRFGVPGEDINVDNAINNGFTGSGVGINVIDSGLEIAHEDLVDNVLDGYSYDFENNDTDPTNPSYGGDHGTSVAGMIAAKGWNNLGGRGVAPNANLIGYNFLNYQCYTCQTQSWGFEDFGGAKEMDIFNMSYGTNNYFYNNGTTFRFPAYNSYSEYYELENTALIHGVIYLRDGKGGIYIKSMGNSFYSNATNGLGCGETDVDPEGAFNCSIRFHDTIHTMPYILGVASLKATGVKSSYSSIDASTWVSGFGGEFGYSEDYFGTGYAERAYEPAMMTTDQSGCEQGYVSYYYYPRNEFNDCWNAIDGPHPDNPNGNYTSSFNGTSAAAPSVAGGVAVLLGEYPDLTWRDVKHIIANTARKNDSTRSYTRNSLVQYDWITNAAGYSHHFWYGFGAFDVGAALDFASTYSLGSLGAFTEYDWKESEAKETIEVSVEANANGSGNVYVIDGVQRKSLTLNVGATYTFIHPSSHPLRFSTTEDGTHGGGIEYTDGVTKSNGVTTIKVGDDAPTTLYYYCDIHPNMGSDIFNLDSTPNLNMVIPSFSSVEDTITYSVESTNNFVEFIQIKIYLDKDIPRDIGLHLISPQGTEMSILHPFTNVADNPLGAWFIMGVAGFYGEEINGDWTLKVTDYTDNDDDGILIDWGINVFGN